MPISNWSAGEDIRADLAAWVIVAALGWGGGWLHGHHAVKADCENLGAFYVGSSTFDCQKAKGLGDGKP